MPWRPPSHHAVPSSRQATNQRYAAERAVAHGPDPRSTARWRRVRALVLAQHPLCADPYGVHTVDGRTVLAEEVDHIQGVWEAPGRVFDLANLQGLCVPCHAQKSTTERMRKVGR